MNKRGHVLVKNAVGKIAMLLPLRLLICEMGITIPSSGTVERIKGDYACKAFNTTRSRRSLTSGCINAIGISTPHSKAPTGHSPKAYVWSQPCVGWEG